MKIAFSTLGCPDWSWGEIVTAAKEWGYHGIEIRGIGHRMYLPEAAPFVGEQFWKTKDHLQHLNLAISCLTSAVVLHETDLEKRLQEGEDYLNLAAKLGVPFIRVLGDTDPAPGNKPFPRPQVKEGLQVLGKSARGKGVAVLIETNGHLADSRLLAELLEEVNDPDVGVLWDIHHPFRFFKEEPQTTAGRLGKAIKYVHVKDSRLENGKIRYCLLGEGDIPVRGILKTLLEQGYNHWLSLEWVKKWNPPLAEPGIVFPHFISTINRYINDITG